jgi:hypothetical protein
MKLRVASKRYQMLCEMLDQASCGDDVWYADLIRVRTNLLKYNRYFKRSDTTRRLLAELIGYQVGGDLLGPWRISAGFKPVSGFHPQERLYIFSRA